jgi:type IV pilus assembly protein PilB
VKNHKEIRVGEFFVENGIITREQLDEALELQRFNRDRILGEILVTQGVLTKEEIIMAMEMYMMLTGLDTEHADEWLDQEEIDLLIEKCKNNPKEC